MLAASTALGDIRGEKTGVVWARKRIADASIEAETAVFLIVDFSAPSEEGAKRIEWVSLVDPSLESSKSLARSLT